MKVGIVCPYDWSHPGGVRTHILGLAAALGRKGIENEIVAPSARPEEGIFAVGRTVGVPSNGSVARICFSRSAKSRIESRLEAGDLDLLHLHEPVVPSASLLALMYKDAARSVATFHASARRSLGYALMKPVLARYLNRVERRIAVSGAALQFISQYFPGRYSLIPNGIDTRRFLEASPDPGLLGYKPFVLFLGRPERRKGFQVLLEAMRILRSQRDVRLVSVGAAPRVDEKWIVPLGVVEDERVPGIYAAADLFCAPSLGGESFGIVLGEAMAAGTAVVASDIPGYREAAAGAARLVTPGDPGALASAIEELLADPDSASQWVTKGKERAASLDWEVIADAVISVYEEALQGEGRLGPPV